MRDGLTVVALGAIVVLRRPEAITQPSFFVNEGPLFTDALAGGSVLAPYAGYLVLPQRIAMAMAALLPPPAAPLFTNLVAIAAAAAVAGLILVRLRQPLLAFGFVLLPGTWYVLGTMADVQWVTGVYLLIVLAAPRRWDVAGVALIGLQGPIALLLAPLFVARWWICRDSLAIVAVVVTTSLAQVVTLLATGRGLSGEHSELPMAVAWRGIVVPLLGTTLSQGVSVLVAIPIAAVLVWVALQLGRAGALLAGVWAIFVGAGVLLSPYPSHVIWSDLALTERHFYLAGVAIAGVILLGVARRIPAAYVLAPVLVAAMVVDFRLPPLVNDWATRSLCIGGPVPCTVPVVGGGPDWDVQYRP